MNDRPGRIAGMTPERWQQVKSLFNQAVEREPAARSAFVAERSGGDAELVREVESLLAKVNETEHLIDRPVVKLTAPLDGDGAGLLGQHIGPYRIVREIGWGGMGTVYEAVRDDEAFRKRVAIKVVRREMATQGVVLRFRHERQILAELEHPNIAGLLDGGVTGDGRPYFAMEYVEGKPIDRYCRARELPLTERIALFLAVCDAVQYAHRNLVVHRDLKPGNILVTDAGEPKLLDFGIAKLLDDGSERAAAQLTVAGDVMLTPDYASPEQVKGAQITTASDVYSLGIILYELLSGTRPYRLEGRPLQEMVRTITESEPVPPSAAVAGAEDRLKRRLAGELDSIVLKAIRKEPERRYLSVEQLSEDLRRYLDGRPVLAQSDSALYRVRKFVKRHTAVVATVSLVIVTLAGGIVATLTQARRAEAERARAEERFNDVRGLANSVLFEIHDGIAELPGATATRALLVSRGVEYLDKLSRQSSGDPTLEREIATAYLRLGQVQGQPSGANLGDLHAARTSYLRALSIAEGLLKTDPADRSARRSIALGHERLSEVEAYSGDVPAGVSHAREALRNWRRLAESDPTVPAQLAVGISHVKLGDVLGNPSFPNAGDAPGAMEEYRSSLVILSGLAPASEQERNVRRYIGLVHERIGEMHLMNRRHDEAVSSFEKAAAIRQLLSKQNPADLVVLRDIGVSHEKICSVYMTQGDWKSAAPQCQQSLAIYQRLYDHDPREALGRNTLGIGHRWTHRVLAAKGDLQESLRHLEKSTKLFRDALESQADSVAARRYYAHNLFYSSMLHARMANEARRPALERSQHRRIAAADFEQARKEIEAFRTEGDAMPADEEMLQDARSLLDRMQT